jgi:hypothetical protein
VLHELKAYVSADTQDRHTPEERVLHAQCAWDVYTAIATAAVANSRDVEFEFESFAPELLQAVIDATPAATPIPYTFGAIQACRRRSTISPAAPRLHRGADHRRRRSSPVAH